MAIKWAELAKAKGFDTAYDMMSELYELHNQNIMALCQYLQISHPMVSKQLVLLGIVAPSLKNGSHPGKYVCRHCKQTFQGDRRKVCCENPDCIEKEKQFRKDRQMFLVQQRQAKGKTKNPCRICGQPKGVNRFFCNHCLQFVGAGSMAEGH